MNKNILAIAIAAVVAAPSAFAASTVYGVAHMSVDAVNNAAAGAENGSQTNLSSNSSRIGIKGSEDLGSGLKAIYQWESTVGFDGETNGGTGGWGVQRNTFAGLAGGFGTVLLGIHDTPLKMVGRKYELFGDQVGDFRNLTRPAGGALGWDERPTNVVAYVTPNMGGFSAVLAYVMDEKNSKSNANNADAYSLSAGYAAGKFNVDAAYENHAKGLNGVADKDMTAFRLGASYDFGGIKLLGFYANQDVAIAANTVKARNIYGIGAGFKVGAAGTIKAQIGVSDKISSVDDSGATMYAIGYDHALSKNTTVYAAYALTDNQNAAAFSVNGGGGHGETTGVNAGKDPSAFSVGLIHKF